MPSAPVKDDELLQLKFPDTDKKVTLQFKNLCMRNLWFNQISKAKNCLQCNSESIMECLPDESMRFESARLEMSMLKSSDSADSD
jgi:hypothetical protein